MSFGGFDITPGGDIVVHGRSGVFIEVNYKDEAGAPVNIASAPLFFEIDGVVRVALGAGAVNSQRIIQIDEAIVAQIPAAGADWCIVDQSGAVNQVPMQGRIRVRGYRSAPA